MSIDLSQFHGMFFQESNEAVDTIESACLAVAATDTDHETVNRIFRATHSIKGSSATFGFSQVARFTHVMESLLDKIRSAELDLSQPVADVLLHSVDGLRAMLAAAQQGNPLDSDEFLRYQQPLEAIVLNSSAVLMDTESRFPGSDKPGCETGTADVADAFPAAHQLLQSASENHSAKPEPKALGQKVSTHAGNGMDRADGKSVRVDTEKIDLLVNLVSEIVITQSMLGLLSEDEVLGNHDQLQQGLLQLQQQTRRLQEGVMQIRMLPIAFCFNRCPRLVRDISSQLGKNIKLVISGEHTEVDKTIIEGIADPLLHLLRNCIDHGIETPDKRREKGKAECGQIRISALHRAGHMVIEVEDDGSGLDVGLLVSKAKHKQLIAAHTELTDDQALELIFLPGFSTREEVSDLSGRGVGMDVVRRNIQTLGGNIQVRSEAGKGTSFTINLPLTLAIMESQLVRVSNETYVIPLIRVIESLQLEATMIDSFPNARETIKYQDKNLPLVRLAELFETTFSEPEGLLIKNTEGVITIVESDFGRYGLYTDELLAQQQVVVKPLEEHYQSVRGISGATILGNGRIALILDVDALHRPVNPSEIPFASAG